MVVRLLLTVYIHITHDYILYYVYFCLFCCKAFSLCFFFHLDIADSKQEEFQEGKCGQIQAVITFVVNFCQHCYSELTPTT